MIRSLCSDVTSSSTYTAERNEPIDEEPMDLRIPRISVSYSSFFLNGNKSIDESSMTDGPLQSTFLLNKVNTLLRFNNNLSFCFRCHSFF